FFRSRSSLYRVGCLVGARRATTGFTRCRRGSARFSGHHARKVQPKVGVSGEPVKRVANDAEFRKYPGQETLGIRRKYMINDPLGIAATLTIGSATAQYASLSKLADKTGADVARLPHTVKILMENIARRVDGRGVTQADVEALAHWPNGKDASIAFMPARVLMQDFTGVPAVVDLAAMRSAVARAGGDPQSVNPFVPVDLVIDHSVQVDRFGSDDAYAANLEWEYRRNRERYALLNWAQQAFDGFRVVPPGM